MGDNPLDKCEILKLLLPLELFLGLCPVRPNHTLQRANCIGSVHHRRKFKCDEHVQLLEERSKLRREWVSIGSPQTRLANRGAAFVGCRYAAILIYSATCLLDPETSWRNIRVSWSREIVKTGIHGM